jgi:hypothetical protein
MDEKQVMKQAKLDLFEYIKKYSDPKGCIQSIFIHYSNNDLVPTIEVATIPIFKEENE